MTGYWKYGRLHLMMVFGLVTMLMVSGCGRRGPLEAPPSATVLSTNAQGEVVEEPTPVEDRPFVLDALIQ